MSIPRMEVPRSRSQRATRPVFLVLAAAALLSAGKAAGTDYLTVLKGQDYWRAQVVRWADMAEKYALAPPPDWSKPDFDDRNWWLRRGAILTDSPEYSNAENYGTIYVRGAFEVSDPAKVTELFFSAQYRGGIVVYLNGVEAARQHLPAGALDWQTPAEPYPTEAYLMPKGGALEDVRGRDAERERDKRLMLRTRSLERTALPARLLRKGTNVIAAEIHRAAPSQGAKARLRWYHVAWVNACLETSTDGESAFRRSGDFRLWNADTLFKVEPADHRGPAEPLRPLRIVAARNGFFSGQVILSGQGALHAVEAKISDLAQENGPGRIPAAAAQIRYAQVQQAGVEGAWKRLRFDGLWPAFQGQPVPNAAGAVQPIWVTLRTNPDTPPGEYRGKLTVRVQGETSGDGSAPETGPTLEAAVSVRVCGWSLPDPKDYSVWMDLLQSPETLAMRYGVDRWSEKHLALIERSMEYQARVGNKVVYIPLVAETHFGNDESWVRWIEDGKGGFRRDYAIMDRYLDLHDKHLDRPKVVCLYLYRPFANGACSVTVLDPGTGKSQAVTQAPITGSAENEAFWKPVLDEIAQRLTKRGYPKDSIMLGAFADPYPSQALLQSFQRIAPDIKWVRHAHQSFVDTPGGPYGYVASVYMSHTGYRGPAWNRPVPCVVFPRPGSHVRLCPGSQTELYRMAVETTLQRSAVGLGRLGLDYWDVMSKATGITCYSTSKTLFSRYPEDDWRQLSEAFGDTALLCQGPEGALSTIRFEMLCQGMEEGEALIFIGKALDDETVATRLGDALVRRAKDLLALRSWLLETASSENVGDNRMWPHFPAQGWDERAATLYDTAAEIARALAEPQGQPAGAGTPSREH